MKMWHFKVGDAQVVGVTRDELRFIMGGLGCSDDSTVRARASGILVLEIDRGGEESSDDWPWHGAYREGRANG